MLARPRGWQAEIGDKGLGKAVLVVDDEPAIRGLLKVALERKGFAVLLAAEASEALAVYGAHRSKVALVLLDVRLPGWDGPQILTALQSINPELCCCFMTGNGGNYTEQELLERGAAQVFAKPVPLAELVSAIEQLVGFQAR
jgi:DNA-binding NtrC family response regulator